MTVEKGEVRISTPRVRVKTPEARTACLNKAAENAVLHLLVCSSAGGYDTVSLGLSESNVAGSETLFIWLLESNVAGSETIFIGLLESNVAGELHVLTPL